MAALAVAIRFLMLVCLIGGGTTDEHDKKIGNTYGDDHLRAWLDGLCRDVDAG
jgi:hypothetical protein